jgi:hypothetical protein
LFFAPRLFFFLLLGGLISPNAPPRGARKSFADGKFVRGGGAKLCEFRPGGGAKLSPCGAKFVFATSLILDVGAQQQRSRLAERTVTAG